MRGHCAGSDRAIWSNDLIHVAALTDVRQQIVHWRTVRCEQISRGLNVALCGERDRGRGSVKGGGEPVGGGDCAVG